jgi:glutathione synthase/RimK-type ligase-like ATP-grasp enzyme
MARVDVALLTDGRYERPTGSVGVYVRNILDEDALVVQGLASRGLSSVRVDWARSEFDWAGVACAVFRTTWDYFHRFAEFSAWLDRVATLTPLVNPIGLVRWNLDKHYLLDLRDRGIRIVPTHFVEVGARTSLAQAVEICGWTEAVLKPAVSGAGRHTYRFDRARVGEHEHVFAELLRAEAWMVQPFQREITHSGELTLVVIGGRCTHAVRKIARAGEFRVQNDHGGTVHPHAPTREEAALAERVVAACSPTPAYARVDVVVDNDGQLAVMELELIEPELFLRFHPPAADALAEEVAQRLTQAGR